VPGSNLGDAIGIGWFLDDVDGGRTVGHGGSANAWFAVPVRRPATLWRRHGVGQPRPR
jgi:hypothetical protein